MTALHDKVKKEIELEVKRRCKGNFKNKNEAFVLTQYIALYMSAHAERCRELEALNKLLQETEAGVHHYEKELSTLRAGIKEIADEMESGLNDKFVVEMANKLRALAGKKVD